MDLSFKDCFDDNKLEGPSSLSAGNKSSQVYCPHCCGEVHRSTFYRHKTKYLLDEPSKSQSESDLREMFDGEFHDNGEPFADCRINRQQESPGSSDDDRCDLSVNHDDVEEIENSDNHEVATYLAQSYSYVETIISPIPIATRSLQTSELL